MVNQSSTSTITNQTSFISTNDTHDSDKEKRNDTKPIDDANKTKQHDSILITSLQLPNELLGLIFNYIVDSRQTLYECTLASKQCHLVATPLLWKTPVFHRDSARQFLDCVFGMQFERRDMIGQHIQNLVVTDYWDDDDLLLLLPHLPQLKHLTLVSSEWTITDTTVCQLPRYCPRLSSLKLAAGLVTPTALTALAQCPLEDFEWIMSSTQQPSLAFLAPCPLRRLCIAYKPRRPSSAIMDLPFDQLICLDIYGIYGHFLNVLLSDACFPRLKQLRFAHCKDVDDAALGAFVKSHPLLEQVALNYLRTLTDDTLDALCSLPRLTHLSMKANPHITPAVVRRLIISCPLVYLNVTLCRHVLESEFPELDTTEINAFDQSALEKIRHHHTLV